MNSNLHQALIEDITAGIAAAITAGELPKNTAKMPVVVKKTDDPEHGDYASPIALALGKVAKQAPVDIVQTIILHMPKRPYVGSLEVAPPGFLNIRLNTGWLTARLDDLVEADLCDLSVGKGRSVNLEFISANPTGPMTMGNARTAFTADTLANILACAGFTVTREYYVNDAGEQIRRLGQSVVRRALQAQGESVDFPEDLYQGDYIKPVAATIAESWQENEGRVFTLADLDDAEVVARVSRQAVDILQAGNQRIATEDLKIDFDVFTSEQALRDSGAVDAVVKKLRQAKATFTKDGAEWLKTSEHGTEKDDVIVKDNGHYTYFAPDIAYNQNKADREYDLIFTFLGADHLGHAPKIIAAMDILGNDTRRWKFVISQMFRIMREGKPVKLSKRAGVIEQPKDLIEAVGYDAARFMFLLHSLSTHMDFDLDMAREQSERNPVYYVQYAHVRLQSIIRRAKEEGVIEQTGDSIPLTSRAELTHTMELALMRQLYRFPEVIAEIAETYEVHTLAYYATDLARAIHAFYRNVPVLKGDDAKLVMSRLQLVLAARKVLRQTLDLLGVAAPDIM